MTPENTSPSPERLMQLAWGYAPTLILEAAVTHGIFDRLAPGPLTLESLASSAGVSIRGLRAVADSLVGLQLLTRSEAG